MNLVISELLDGSKTYIEIYYYLSGNKSEFVSDYGFASTPVIICIGDISLLVNVSYYKASSHFEN